MGCTDNGDVSILVTGGAGYIGSHTVLALVQAGDEVVVADNLINSSPVVIDRLTELTGRRIPFERVDVGDEEAVARVIETHEVEEVIHFAGLKSVAESVADPLTYYRHNLLSTLNLLNVLDTTGVRRFVFSSSATVYGAEAASPVREEMPTSAANPYGWTKVMLERVLMDLAASNEEWRIGILRYFNPVGAHPSGRLGEDPRGVPNNLMPYVTQVAVGRRDRLTVFGGDYDTVDGTGVRDFIHVEDLAAGHVSALRYLRTTAEPVSLFNLGTGAGTSVLQLVAAFERASGRPVPVQIAGRREGDLAVSYADPSRSNEVLGWRATRTIDDICLDAWRWQSNNPNGYGPPGDGDGAVRAR